MRETTEFLKFYWPVIFLGSYLAVVLSHLL